MIIFLYGPDDWRREEKKRFIISEFLSKNSNFGLKKIDMGEDGAEALGEFMSQKSIFEEKKLAVVSGYLDFGKPEDISGFMEEKNLTILVSEGDKKPGKENMFLLKKPVISEAFPLLSGAEWRKFAEKQAEACGIALDKEAMEFVLRAYEGDSWRLATEFQKLSFLGKGRISLRDLAEFDIEVDPDYWTVMQRTKGSSLPYRLTGFEILASQNEPMQKAFFVLSSMWNEKLPHFAEQDFLIKSGKLDYEEALLSLVLE